MSTFAKLYDSLVHGQIMITRNKDKRGRPAVSCHIQVAVGDVYASCVSFADTEEGARRADIMFKAMSEPMAVRLADDAAIEHFTYGPGGPPQCAI